jgi:hypothetical protein
MVIGFPSKLSDSQKASQLKSSRVVDSTPSRSVVHPESNLVWDTYSPLTSESWLSLSADHEMTWLPDGDEVPDREKHMIQSPKLMLTFVWNLHEFQVVDATACHAKRGEIHRRYYI